MDWTNITLASLITGVITGIVTWLIRPYFGSYLTKKGENWAVREDLDKINRQLETIKSEFVGPNAYALEKAKGLATKEDIEEITRKVEGVRSEVSVKLELIKWELGKKATIHHLAAEKEFEALAEIGKGLYELKSATMGLRPTMDVFDPNEPVMERHNRRYQDWAKSYRSFMDAIEKPKLFLPTYLYHQFIKIRNLSHKEGVGFEFAVKYGSEKGQLNFNAYKEADKNIEELNQAIEEALTAIRKRYDIDG